MQYKIVMNKKYTNYHPFFKKSKRENLSEILDKYNGFEGECIYYHQSNDIEEINLIIKKCKKELEKKNKLEYLLLIIFPNNIQNKQFMEHKAFFIGYDYGLFQDRDDIYSSILHEILFGHRNELIEFKNSLNECFLFPSISSIEKYLKIHHKLLIEGKDVEVEENMNIYEIWSVKL